MRRPTFLRVYSSDATEKADEATPINRSEDNTRNSIDNNELHLYTELHNDEQMLMFRPTMALEGPVARSYFDGTWPWQCAVVLLLPIQVHPPGGKQGLTAVLGSLAWAGVRRLLCRPPDARG